jgi:hypothetical protein
VDAEIFPEPSPDERAALEEAIARLLEPPSEPRSAWWHEGVRESVSPEEEPG